jgi:hypothetical protein
MATVEYVEQATLTTGARPPIRVAGNADGPLSSLGLPNPNKLPFATSAPYLSPKA